MAHCWLTEPRRRPANPPGRRERGTGRLLAQNRGNGVTPRCDTSAAAFRELVHVGPLHHRNISLPDLPISASAQDSALGVLHYDEDFDVLAGVLEFESRWIGPRGSL